jgi:hypothetical protein
VNLADKGAGRAAAGEGPAGGVRLFLRAIKKKGGGLALINCLDPQPLMRPRSGAGEHVRVNLADKIVMRPVGALVPYASNSRTHTPAQLDKLARSISEFGFTNPILVDGENGVISGHARLAVAQKLGLAEVPTIDLSWLTPAQRQAYVLADNRLAEEAGCHGGRGSRKSASHRSAPSASAS